jgi:hypothetical protein
MRVVIGLLSFVVGCGAPLLTDAPRPSPAKVAVAAAGVATALTLADPAGQAQNVEDAYVAELPEDKPIPIKATVPADVLDRLDRAR